MRNRNLMIGAGLAVAGIGATAAYVYRIRPWHLRWGATDEELRESLPGDELVSGASLKATHAITINAPAADIWPWLVQMGKTAAGSTAIPGSKIWSAVTCATRMRLFRSGKSSKWATRCGYTPKHRR